MKKNKRLIACLCIASMLLSGVSVSAANESDSSVEQAAEDIQTDQIQRPETDQGTSEDGTDTAEAASGNETTDDTVTSEEESVVTENPDTPENATGEREVVSVDEKGNVFIVDDENDGVIHDEIETYARTPSVKVVNFRANQAGNAVSGVTTYTEYGTGASGYVYGKSGADAAYLGEENGKVKFMQSGVVGLVDKSKVQVVNLSSVRTYSNYYADGTSILHRICMNMSISGYGGTTNIGPQQSYMKTGTTYYSYDGHYFYTDYETMIADYKRNTRKNSVNPNNPYYNYYQYLPLRGLSSYSANELNNIINQHASKASKMYNKGSQFVSNQNTYGVNALLMTGVGALESAWGTSSISQQKNNLFGLNAVDSSPGTSADRFSSVDICIKDFAETYMSKRYLRAGWDFYHGGFLGNKASGMNVSYASDAYWGEKIASLAWTMDSEGGKKDRNKYKIGIKDTLPTSHTALNVRKEASTSTTSLYNTGSSSNYAFLILGESGSFYKVQSDPVLNSGRTKIDKNTGKYNASAMYAYSSKDYIKVVNSGSSGSNNSSSGSNNNSSGNNSSSTTKGIVYSTHVQTYGWQSNKSNGQTAGTSGEAKRMEAIRIRLTGEVANHYDIYYRVHTQTYGWLDWAKNGDIAGTTDAAKRMEAIQIVLVTKGGSAPGATTQAYVQPLTQYNTHVQTYGWKGNVYGGGYGGTIGEAKRMEAFRLKLTNQPYSGGIKYQAHVQSAGWKAWKENDAVAGTTGSAKRLEAVKIELTGQMAQKYDIYYRVHAQTYGWLGGAKNGEIAGTTGLAKRLECIQIVLVKKGAAAPGDTTKACVTK